MRVVISIIDVQTAINRRDTERFFSIERLRNEDTVIAGLTLDVLVGRGLIMGVSGFAFAGAVQAVGAMGFAMAVVCNLLRCIPIE